MDISSRFGNHTTLPDQDQGVLPDFIIIGVQKSGTSWLSKMLGQHPDVYLPAGEVHYFDKSYNFEKGVEWYRHHFSESESGQTIGEKTPDYIWANGDGVEGHLPDVHRNLYDLLPDARLIVTFRNPVQRAISAVKHIVRSGRVSPRHSLDDLLIGSAQNLVSGHGVIEYGYYQKHLDAYLDLFRREQILVLIFEQDIVASPNEGIRKVCSFLDLSVNIPDRRDEKVNAHRASLLEMYARYYTPRLSRAGYRLRVWQGLRKVFPPGLNAPRPETVDALYAHYRSHNQQLQDLLGRDLPASWWGSN